MKIAMGTNRWMPWALGAFIAAMSAGCAASSQSVDDDDTDEAGAAVQSDAALDARADRGPEGHGRAMGGPAILFRIALDDLELTDAQRSKIEGAMEALKPPKPGDHARPDTTALADAVRAGKVDPAALAPAGAGPDGADHAARHAAFVAAIQELHDTLTPEQRAKLVASAKDKMDKHDEHGDRRGPPGGDRGMRPGGDDARMGRRGPPDGARGAHAGMKRGHGSPTDHLLEGLDVTDAQRTQIDAALAKAGLSGPPADAPSREEMAAKMGEMKARGAAMLDAFAKDAFDAETAVPEPPDGARMHGPPQGRFVEALAVITPLLDQTQRDALADRIAEGPQRRGQH